MAGGVYNGIVGDRDDAPFISGADFPGREQQDDHYMSGEHWLSHGGMTLWYEAISTTPTNVVNQATALAAFNHNRVIAKPVTAITVQGGAEKLVPVIAPTNALNQDVVWATSDPAVAVVEPDGTVHGVSAGVALIKATTVR